MQFKSICFEIYFNQCFPAENDFKVDLPHDMVNYKLKIMWRVHIKEKYIKAKLSVHAV